MQGFPHGDKSVMVRPHLHPAPPLAERPAILQVIPALDAGGAERTAIDIAEALEGDGLHGLVASAGGRLEPVLVAAGGELIRMNVETKAPAALLRNATALYRLARRRNVKLIHARSRAPAWSALWAARFAGLPFVTTYHGIYNAGNPLKRFYNSVMARGDAVIANSQWTADHLMAEHGASRERVHVIHRGVDTAVFDPAGVAPDRVAAMRAAWGARDGDTVVLLPGRLTRWKGQSVFLAALASLRREARLENVRAAIVGDAQGRDGYVGALHEAIAAEGLGDIVRLDGHVADMAAAYLAADIVVSASTEPEAFGRVAAEASAMARPVIATDHGGARETVLHGASGLLVAPGSAVALAGALRTLLAMDAETRARMGEAGRAHVLAHFTKTRMCAETIALYRKLLKPAG